MKARALQVLCLAVLFATPPVSRAAPPKVPPSVPVTVGAVEVFDVEGKDVGYQPTFTPAECVFVRLHSADPDRLSFLIYPKTPGPHAVVFWTKGELTGSVVRFNTSTPLPPPTPGDPPPTQPPPAPSAALFFVIVRPEGPATPAFTKLMASPSWVTLKAAGHRFKDYAPSELARIGLSPASVPTQLPAVITLRTSAEGSRVVRDAVPLPTTDDGILQLPEGVRP